jgi:serine protease AprX
MKRVVVTTARGGDLAGVERAVRRIGGRPESRIPVARAVLAAVPAESIGSLRRSSAVGGVTVDRELHALADEAPAAGGTTPEMVGKILGTDALASGGHDGDGVDVALIDTGVAAAPALDDSVIDGPDFSSTGDDPDLRGLDAFGHGTHMAGIVHGVAPGARILNVKVAEHDGVTTLGRMLMAIDWVVRHRDEDDLDVRVLNLSFGGPVDGSYRSDPLAYALERAQKKGIAVIVAAGNGGGDTVGLDSPAYDPNLIAVGADDDARTIPLTDDAVPVWSSRGDGDRDPDVIAPGTGIVSLAAPDSFLYENYPGARVGEDGFRGSGTSQAAAGVSGLAAAVLSARADLDPAELKSVLRATARPLPGVPAAEQGAGVPDGEAAAVAEATRSEDKPRPAKGGGHWRGRDGEGPSAELAVDPQASRWSASRWSASRWSASRWSASRWSASRWSASRWSASRWSASRWSASRRSASRWSASRWSGSQWASLTPESQTP